jgi:glutathione transport system ATP-binding protein
MAMGVIFITHDMGVVADIADRVLVMYQGEAVETGTVEEIFRAPQHLTPKRCWRRCRAGAMNGSDLPRRFPLISLQHPEQQDGNRAGHVVPGEPICRCAIWWRVFAAQRDFKRVTREVMRKGQL